MFGFGVHALRFVFCTFFFLTNASCIVHGHEQYIKVNEQYFISVNNNQKLFFYYFQFLVNF